MAVTRDALLRHSPAEVPVGRISLWLQNLGLAMLGGLSRPFTGIHAGSIFAEQMAANS